MSSRIRGFDTVLPTQPAKCLGRDAKGAAGVLVALVHARDADDLVYRGFSHDAPPDFSPKKKKPTCPPSHTASSGWGKEVRQASEDRNDLDWNRRLPNKTYCFFHRPVTEKSIGRSEQCQGGIGCRVCSGPPRMGACDSRRRLRKAYLAEVSTFFA